jgi:hypothetical protein
LKRILKLGRLRLRGPRGAQDEFCSGRHCSEPTAARIAGCATATRSGSVSSVAQKLRRERRGRGIKPRRSK